MLGDGEVICLPICVNISLDYTGCMGGRLIPQKGSDQRLTSLACHETIGGMRRNIVTVRDLVDNLTQDEAIFSHNERLYRDIQSLLMKKDIRRGKSIMGESLLQIGKYIFIMDDIADSSGDNRSDNATNIVEFGGQRYYKLSWLKKYYEKQLPTYQEWKEVQEYVGGISYLMALVQGGDQGFITDTKKGGSLRADNVTFLPAQGEDIYGQHVVQTVMNETTAHVAIRQDNYIPCKRLYRGSLEDIQMYPTGPEDLVGYVEKGEYINVCFASDDLIQRVQNELYDYYMGRSFSVPLFRIKRQNLELQRNVMDVMFQLAMSQYSPVFTTAGDLFGLMKKCYQQMGVETIKIDEYFFALLTRVLVQEKKYYRLKNSHPQEMFEMVFGKSENKTISLVDARKQESRKHQNALTLFTPQEKRYMKMRYSRFVEGGLQIIQQASKMLHGGKMIGDSVVVENDDKQKEHDMHMGVTVVDGYSMQINYGLLDTYFAQQGLDLIWDISRIQYGKREIPPLTEKKILHDFRSHDIRTLKRHEIAKKKLYKSAREEDKKNILHIAECKKSLLAGVQYRHEKDYFDRNVFFFLVHCSHKTLHDIYEYVRRIPGVGAVEKMRLGYNDAQIGEMLLREEHYVSSGEIGEICARCVDIFSLCVIETKETDKESHHQGGDVPQVAECKKQRDSVFEILLQRQEYSLIATLSPYAYTHQYIPLMEVMTFFLQGKLDNNILKSMSESRGFLASLIDKYGISDTVAVANVHDGLTKNQREQSMDECRLNAIDSIKEKYYSLGQQQRTLLQKYMRFSPNYIELIDDTGEAFVRMYGLLMENTGNDDGGLCINSWDVFFESYEARSGSQVSIRSGFLKPQFQHLTAGTLGQRQKIFQCIMHCAGGWENRFQPYFIQGILGLPDRLWTQSVGKGIGQFSSKRKGCYVDFNTLSQSYYMPSIPFNYTALDASGDKASVMLIERLSEPFINTEMGADIRNEGDEGLSLSDRIQRKIKDIMKVDKQASSRFQSAIHYVEESRVLKNNEEGKKHLLQRIVRDVSYVKRRGKICLIIKGILPSPLSCQDPIPGEMSFKFGVQTKIGHNAELGKNKYSRVPSLQTLYAKNRFYYYHKLGLGRVDKEKTGQFFMTKKQIDALIAWGGGSNNDFTSKVLAKLINIPLAYRKHDESSLVVLGEAETTGPYGRKKWEPLLYSFEVGGNVEKSMHDTNSGFIFRLMEP